MFTDSPSDPVIASDAQPFISGHARASMIGASLVMLPLYAIAICWLLGENWRSAIGIGLGSASILVGLGILFAIGRANGESGTSGEQSGRKPT